MKMKNRRLGWTSLLFLLVVFLVSGSPKRGYAILIQDNYVGADPTHHAWDGKDLIGNNSLFQISQMEVTFGNSDGMHVDIYTTYLNNIGKYHTQLGDLFISTDGWSPFGTAPYINDNQSNGESWEYALVMDNHLPDSSGGTLSGDAHLYLISDPSRIIESYAPDGYVYRAGQEVQFDPQGLTALATGSWSIGNWGDPDTDDFLRFAIDYDFSNVSEVGLHYAMTCGNDVIEGGAPVPEPATILLFGAGLLGFAGLGRKRLLKRS